MNIHKTKLCSVILTGILTLPVCSNSYSSGNHHVSDGKHGGGHHGGGHHGGGHSGGEHTHVGHGRDHQVASTSTTGGPVSKNQANKTIKVTALDNMRYQFSEELTIVPGDVVKFVVTNTGRLPHEFSIGDEKEQMKHREMMRKMPGMTHQDGNTITVNPGETKEIVWRFKKNDNVVFACNIAGHFEAGMTHKISVR